VTINKEGRGAVSSDPEGADFPWQPKPVTDCKSGPGSLNDVPTVIAFCEGCHPGMQATVLEAMKPVAQKYLDKAKAAGEEDPAYAFMMATEVEGIVTRLRELMELPKEAATQPRLMLLDIPDEGGFYSGPEGEITADSVAKFLADYEAKVLTRQQLSRG
jgi:nucleoredoxin